MSLTLVISLPFLLYFYCTINGHTFELIYRWWVLCHTGINVFDSPHPFNPIPNKADKYGTTVIRIFDISVESISYFCTLQV